VHKSNPFWIARTEHETKYVDDKNLEGSFNAGRLLTIISPHMIQIAGACGGSFIFFLSGHLLNKLPN